MAKESAYFRLETTPDAHVEKQIKRSLAGFPGVNSVTVSRENRLVAVDYDNTGVTANQLSGRLRTLGCRITADRQELHPM